MVKVGGLVLAGTCAWHGCVEGCVDYNQGCQAGGWGGGQAAQRAVMRCTQGAPLLPRSPSHTHAHPECTLPTCRACAFTCGHSPCPPGHAPCRIWPAALAAARRTLGSCSPGARTACGGRPPCPPGRAPFRIWPATLAAARRTLGSCSPGARTACSGRPPCPPGSVFSRTWAAALCGSRSLGACSLGAHTACC